MSKIDGTDWAQNISRVARSRQAARSAYDRLSRWYDFLASSEEAFNRRALALLNAQKGEWVLEVGFGTGHSLEALARDGCRVSGADLSFGMAQAARRRVRKKGLAASVLPSLGDGVHLPYPDDCFDIVFTAFTLELFDTAEIPSVLREIGRVLRPGGRLGVVALSLPAQPGAVVRIYEWFHRILPAYVDCRPIPVTDFVSQNGFMVNQVECKRMWGLPVEIVVGENSSSHHRSLRYQTRIKPG